MHEHAKTSCGIIGEIRRRSPRDETYPEFPGIASSAPPASSGSLLRSSSPHGPRWLPSLRKPREVSSDLRRAAFRGESVDLVGARGRSRGRWYTSVFTTSHSGSQNKGARLLSDLTELGARESTPRMLERTGITHQ